MIQETNDGVAFDMYWCSLEPYERPEYEDAWKLYQYALKYARPDGFVLVPREPTEAMIAAWVNAPLPAFLGKGSDEANKIVCTSEWTAMIDASPNGIAK
jgi:hypothetical protein